MVDELGPKNVPTTAVVINPDTGAADVYSRRGGGWRLLDGDISIDKLSKQSLPVPDAKGDGAGWTEKRVDPMSDLPEQSRSNWRQLEYEWQQTRERWRDSTTDYFASHFLEPIESETQGCSRALETLMETLRPRWQRSVPIHNALRGLLIPKDVVVYTPDEVEEWSEVPLVFVTTALRKGKVLSEKQTGSC